MHIILKITLNINMNTIPALLLFILGFVSPSKVVLQDNGYDGVVIAIDKDIPVRNCQETLLGVESLLRSTSDVVFRTTRGRASFRKITVLVPLSWSPSLCTQLQSKLSKSSGENWKDADLKVTHGRHPYYGSRPWVLQSRGCAQQGDYVSLGYETLIQNRTRVDGRLLAQAWLRYRYGVFEESGMENGAIHPTTHRNANGEWVPTACSNVPLGLNRGCDARDATCPSATPDLNGPDRIVSSFMSFPELETVTELCDEGTHNSAAPTPHNLICGSKSVWEVLRASPDFQNNRNVEGSSNAGAIEFRYVKPVPPRLILLVESTNVMNVQKRWDFMRKAVRKLVMYDVPKDFSLGLVLFDSKATTKFHLKSMSDEMIKKSLGSSLPRNPGRIDKHRRCIACGIEESLKLLRESGGTAGGHIAIMVAGSGRVDAQEMQRIERLVANTDVVIHIIVYPLTERFPDAGNGVEIIGSRTGGLTFTVPDDGIGVDSKIGMYYNLLDSLYHTLAAAAGENVLPVKIHSAEHKGGQTNSNGNFWVDSSLGSDTVFEVFYFDASHVGDSIHLISPNGQVIDTANMQSEDANMNMITIRLRKNQEAHGQWQYKLENRADSHQALFVQVTSKPRSVSSVNSIHVKSWSNQKDNRVNLTDISNPLTLFAEVRVGLAPVDDAKVSVVLTKLGFNSNGTHHNPIQFALYDDGLLNADIKKGDGVYSRVLTRLSKGKYTAEFFIEGKLNDHQFSRHARLGILDVIGESPAIDPYPPARVTDLRAGLLPTGEGQVSIAWTAPGDDFDYGQAMTYKVIVNENLLSLRDGNGEILSGWPSPLPSQSIQQHTISWKKFDKIYYLAMYALDSFHNIGILSNVVEIYVPSPLTVAPPSTVTLPNLKIGAPDKAGSRIFGGFGTLQIGVIFGCLGGFVLIAFLSICYCTTFRNKHKLVRGSSKIEEPKDTFNVTISMNDPEKNVENGIIKKEYHSDTWTPTELLGKKKERSSFSARSDDNSDHSGSTKKSCAGSSDPPQYYSNGVQYSYEVNNYNETAYHAVPNASSSVVDNYQANIIYNPQENYNIEAYQQGYAYMAHNSDSFMTEHSDVPPGSQGPPGYSTYAPYDNSMRSNGKIPPPIPPKPKVHYAPEPYAYESTVEGNGRSSANGSVTSSEKRIRNVTMV